MFDPGTKQAWQSITPDADLKARALQQTPEKIVRFPGGRLVKAASSAAACLLFAVLLLQPGKADLLANGQSVSGAVTLQAPAAVAREIALAAEEAAGISILLESDSQLQVSGGRLEGLEEGTLWTVDAPGVYTLQATRKGRTRTYTLEYSAQTGLWTLTPGK